MSKINLSQYDFKDVLEWVCDQFPDEETLNTDLAIKKYTINGYVFGNVGAYCSISIENFGLRYVLRTMKKDEEKQQKPFPAEEYAQLKRSVYCYHTINVYAMTQEEVANMYNQIYNTNKRIAEIEAEFPEITR